MGEGHPRHRREDRLGDEATWTQQCDNSGRSSDRDDVQGVEHWASKQRHPALPVGEVRRLAGRQARRAVRARIVDGVAADVRPRRARPARFVGDGLVRASAASSAGASTWKATAARTRRATFPATSPTAPTISLPRPITCAGRAASSSVMAYGISSGALRAALFAQRHPDRVVAPRARCVRLDRRRRADARAAAQEAARVPRAQAPADRPRVRAFDLRARSSRLRGAARRRCVRRRDPGARRLDAQRHLRRHVLEAAGRRSREDHDADARPARPVRRHRRVRRPDRVLQAAAASRQAVLGDGRDLARELPAEELPDRLSHPACVLHATARRCTWVHDAGAAGARVVASGAARRP